MAEDSERKEDEIKECHDVSREAQQWGSLTL